jgi:hypothetical protein
VIVSVAVDACAGNSARRPEFAMCSGANRLGWRQRSDLRGGREALCSPRRSGILSFPTPSAV